MPDWHLEISLWLDLSTAKFGKIFDIGKFFLSRTRTRVDDSRKVKEEQRAAEDRVKVTVRRALTHRDDAYYSAVHATSFACVRKFL